MRSGPIFGDPKSPFAPNIPKMMDLGIKSFYGEGCTPGLTIGLDQRLQDVENRNESTPCGTEDSEISNSIIDVLLSMKLSGETSCSLETLCNKEGKALMPGCEAKSLDEVDLLVDINEMPRDTSASASHCCCKLEVEVGNKWDGEPCSMHEKYGEVGQTVDGKDLNLVMVIGDGVSKTSDPLLVQTCQYPEPLETTTDTLDGNEVAGYGVKVKTSCPKHTQNTFPVAKTRRPEQEIVTSCPASVYGSFSNAMHKDVSGGGNSKKNVTMNGQKKRPFQHRNCGSNNYEKYSLYRVPPTCYPQPAFMPWRPMTSMGSPWSPIATPNSFHNGSCRRSPYYPHVLPVFSPGPRFESNNGFTDLSFTGQQPSAHRASLPGHMQTPVSTLEQGFDTGSYVQKDLYTRIPPQNGQVLLSSSKQFGPVSTYQHLEHNQITRSERKEHSSSKDLQKPLNTLNTSNQTNNSSLAVLLEGVKSWTHTKLYIKDLFGYLADLCRDQAGSRFIQQQLEHASAEDFSECFQELYSVMFILMLDPFGNYVIQKLFERGSPEQIQMMGDQLRGKVLTLSLHMYGSRVMQKALETLALKMRTSLAKELEGHIAECIKDRSGNYVIQKCIVCLSTSHIGFIIKPLIDQASALATHSYGCRVIQRLLEFCDDDEKKTVLIEEILQHAELLTQDQYGNYVIQHVFEHGTKNQRSRVLQYLCQNITPLSVHKFASNVVEKCLLLGNEDERRQLISCILGRDSHGSFGQLHDMMKDQYGNFVVQRLLEVSSGEQREELLEYILAHLHELKRITYGKHLLGRVQELLQDRVCPPGGQNLEACNQRS